MPGDCKSSDESTNEKQINDNSKNEEEYKNNNSDFKHKLDYLDSFRNEIIDEHPSIPNNLQADKKQPLNVISDNNAIIIQDNDESNIHNETKSKDNDSNNLINSLDNDKNKETKLIDNVIETDLSNLTISKQIISIVFIGHVDAGKSTTAGQILHLLDLIDKRTLEKYKEESALANRESWYLSWALDTNPEERERGKTTEVGKCVFETENKKIYILDAPGHKMYVSDMIVGANQADIAVLVVSARINEFEAGIKGGQTNEHILLSRASGIRNVIVLVNKMDDISVNWNEKRFLEIKDYLGGMLKKIYGKDEIAFIPVSGYLGTNIKENDIKKCPWYKGKSFLNYLDSFEFIRSEEKSFVFCVSEKIKTMGVFLGGKIESGRIERGKEITILPQNIKTTILNIYDDEDVEINSATVGENVKVKIKDFADEICEGNILCENINDYKISNSFTCMMTVLQTKQVISAGYKGVIHMKMAQKNAKIIEFRKEINGKIVRKFFAKKGEKLLAKIQIDSPLVLYNGDDPKKKNWFALRDEGYTVAIGVVRNIK
ncbi:translation termination factor GTPase eRF3 [Conglomerata obtusa]